MYGGLLRKTGPTKSDNNKSLQFSSMQLKIVICHLSIGRLIKMRTQTLTVPYLFSAVEKDNDLECKTRYIMKTAIITMMNTMTTVPITAAAMIPPLTTLKEKIHQL